MRVLWDIMFDPQRGLFFCNPVLLMSIVGVGFFAHAKRWRAEWIVTVYSFVALILFNASYGESLVSWGGGTATGPRQIIASVPFMVLGLAFVPAACNWLLGAIAALSAAIMLMATATNPHFPYEYENPVRDFALQQFMRGDFATNRDAFFGGGDIVAESVAFNLGKLLRLPRPFQLWPLAMLWIVGAFDLSEKLGLWGGRASRRLTQLALNLGIAALFLLSMSQRIMQPFAQSGQHGLLGQVLRRPELRRQQAAYCARRLATASTRFRRWARCRFRRAMCGAADSRTGDGRLPIQDRGRRFGLADDRRHRGDSRPGPDQQEPRRRHDTPDPRAAPNRSRRAEYRRRIVPETLLEASRRR